MLLSCAACDRPAMRALSLSRAEPLSKSCRGLASKDKCSRRLHTWMRQYSKVKGLNPKYTY